MRGVESESLPQEKTYEPCVEDMNEQVDNVVARYVQMVEVIIDGQRKIAHDACHENKTKRHRHPGRGECIAGANLSWMQKGAKIPDYRIVNNVAFIVKLEWGGESIGVDQQADKND